MRWFKTRGCCVFNSHQYQTDAPFIEMDEPNEITPAWINYHLIRIKCWICTDCCKVDTSASSESMQVHWRRTFKSANYLARSLRAKQLVGPSQNNSQRCGYSVFSWVLIGRSSCVCACAYGCRGVSGLQKTAACQSVCCHMQLMGVLPHHSESSCNFCWNEMSSSKKGERDSAHSRENYKDISSWLPLRCCIAAEILLTALSRSTRRERWRRKWWSPAGAVVWMFV